MPPRSAQSATRRRCLEQIERLDALDPDATVTALKPVGDDRTRFTVRAGRARFGPVHESDREGLALSVGSPLDPPARGRLTEALEREAARADALNLLRARSRSRRDLLMRLRRKGHPDGASSAALERLARVGLLDDETLARDRAEMLAGSGRTGPRAAELKLRTLGIEGATASAAVREAFAGADLLGQATEAARRRARSMPDRLDEAARQRRLFGFLARRGYDHETCRQAIAAALAEPSDG